MNPAAWGLDHQRCVTKASHHSIQQSAIVNVDDGHLGQLAKYPNVVPGVSTHQRQHKTARGNIVPMRPFYLRLFAVNAADGNYGQAMIIQFDRGPTEGPRIDLVGTIGQVSLPLSRS
jgi:hypothetical protein